MSEVDDALELLEVDDTFAQRLRLTRERNGWTQDQVAEWTGVSQAQLSRYESGLETPRVANLARLSIGLRVSADWLLGLAGDYRVEMPPPAPGFSEGLE